MFVAGPSYRTPRPSVRAQLLKFVYANQGVGRFTKLGMAVPEFTATFVGVLEIVGGLLLQRRQRSAPQCSPHLVLEHAGRACLREVRERTDGQARDYALRRRPPGEEDDGHA
jgi:hypothetical protein